MNPQPLQDHFHDNLCWGCGPANEHGLHIKSYWEGEEAVCTFYPQSYHCTWVAGLLNGGVIATITDCHCIWTAIAHTYRTEGREIGSEPMIRYVTASLQVSYLQPTPLGEHPVVLRARVKEMSARKALVTCSLTVSGDECARGELVAVRVPGEWGEAK